MNKKMIPTIVLTAVLTICICFIMVGVIRLIPVNLTELANQMAKDLSQSDMADENELVYFGFAAASISMTAIGYYIIAIGVIFVSLICLAVAVHNRHSEMKWVRYYNYFLAVCCLFMLITPIVKMILWQCGY